MQFQSADDIWQNRPDLVKGYIRLAPNLSKMCEEVVFILISELGIEGVEYSSVTSRVKSLDSFLDKIVRKAYVNPSSEVVDMAGVRLVYLYEDDKKLIDEIISDHFLVIEKVDHAVGNGPNNFGYGALHYIVKLGHGVVGPRYDGLRDTVCEIQVRTILQDAWAIVAHHLSYKKEEDVPLELRRKLNALTGLFETADDQFGRLRYEIKSYRDRIEEKLLNDISDAQLPTEQINLESLLVFLKWKYPSRGESEREDAVELLSELQHLGYEQLTPLNAILDRVAPALSAYEAKYPPSEEETGDDTLYNPIGVVRVSLQFVHPHLRKEMSLVVLGRIKKFLHLVQS